MESLWTQIALTAGTVFTAFFVTIRYQASQNSKREKQQQIHDEKLQQMQYEYYERKNGHMERMAKDFTKSNNKMIGAVNKLAIEIKALKTNKRK